MIRISLTLIMILLVGCGGSGGGSSAPDDVATDSLAALDSGSTDTATPVDNDKDDDGVTVEDGDCDDHDPDVGWLCWKSISAADHTACALDTAGRIFCHGSNFKWDREVPNDREYVAVSMGVHHACAIDADGGLHCWGDDEYGQSTPPTKTPFGDPLSPFVEVATGEEHSCARDVLGKVMCWGNNGVGQSSTCLLYTSPSPRDATLSRMPSSA